MLRRVSSCSQSLSATCLAFSSLIGRPSSALAGDNNMTASSHNNLLLLPAAIHSTVRHKAFRAFIDESDPVATLNHAREVKQREESIGQKFSSRYLQALINVAIGHFQAGDYELARECGLYAHDTIVELKGSRYTMLYFSAVTCSKCSKARADQLVRMVEERREAGHVGATRAATGSSWWCDTTGENDKNSTINKHENSTLMGGRGYKTNRKASSSFQSVEQYISFLRSEAAQFDRIAKRLMNLPEKYFMKTPEQHMRDNGTESAGRSSDFESKFSNSGMGGGSSASSTAETNERKASAIREARQRRRYDDELRRARVSEAFECYHRNNDATRSYSKAPLRILKPGGPRTKGKPGLWHHLRVPR